MTPLQQAAKNAWDTYLKDWYVNTKGETKPTYASKWRKSNPGRAAEILQYKNGTGPRPVIGDGYGPMIVNIVDIIKLVADPPPPPPPPPNDPKTTYFPRTFNKEGASDARFCVSSSSPAFSHWDDEGKLFDKGGGRYDTNGLCLGGRDPDFIARKLDGTPLRGAKSMDNFGPCDLYDGLTEWPPDSYVR